MRNVEAFSHRREGSPSFEVIVVVDGSPDDTAVRLRASTPSFPLHVIETANQGAAAARNAGAAAARGELLLFLDDDMEPHPDLLVEHDRSHREGADVVLGDIPIHPQAPPTLLAAGVGDWARDRRARLERASEIALEDFLTGQLSIARAVFERLGGFDSELTRNGMFGGEDVEFGYRVRGDGLRVEFNPKAVSFQYYDVDPLLYLRRAYETGRADEEIAAKHPARIDVGDKAPRLRTRRSRALLGPLVLAPDVVVGPFRALAAQLGRRNLTATWARRLFWGMRTVEYLRGASATKKNLAGGRKIVVLCYHAIDELPPGVLEQYGVPPALFAAQLDELQARGWAFVGLDDVLALLDGKPPGSKRSVLVTFDDAYVGIETAAGMLAERDIPAVAFAVSSLVGKTNEWDAPLGAPTLRLLDTEALRSLIDMHVEIGAHTATHRVLPSLDEATARAELKGSADELARTCLRRPRAVAYPYGEWTPALTRIVAEEGYQAAFTIDAGAIGPASNRHALPRIEVLARDTPRRLWLKVRTAHWPTRRRLFVWRLFRVD